MTKLGPIQPPDLSALLNDYADHLLFRINCHQIGTILSFNETNQTASVALVVLRAVGDTTIPYPVLVDVPVYVPSGGGAVLTMPIAAGDTCLVLFNDRDIDNWFENGATSLPNTDRSHSLADGLAIVGFRSKANSVANYSTTDAQLRKGNTVIGMDGAQLDLHNATNTMRTLCENLASTLYFFTTTTGLVPDATTRANILAWQDKCRNLFK